MIDSDSYFVGSGMVTFALLVMLVIGIPRAIYFWLEERAARRQGMTPDEFRRRP